MGEPAGIRGIGNAMMGQYSPAFALSQAACRTVEDTTGRQLSEIGRRLSAGGRRPALLRPQLVVFQWNEFWHPFCCITG